MNLHLLRLAIALPTAFLLTFSAHAQADQELGSWLMYFGKNTLSDRWSLHTETQMRLYEATGNFNQSLNRVGMNYQVENGPMLTLGYALIITDAFTKIEGQSQTVEHRIWQQMITNNKYGRVAFEHRYRLEQRWVTSPIFETELRHRARYRLFASIALNNNRLIDNTFFLALYDEIFIDIDTSPFDQNRAYAALGYKLNNMLSFQAGYLYHRAGTQDLDRLQVAAFINPDFRKGDGD